jgi:hypothetical protein
MGSVATKSRETKIRFRIASKVWSPRNRWPRINVLGKERVLDLLSLHQVLPLVNNANSTDLDSLCESNRGGVFDPFKSSTWHNEGLFELGADTRLGNQGYALYGLDDLTYGSTGVVQSSAIIGQVNDTGLATSFQTWLGFFGLGIVPGNFTDVASLSSISALVEKVAVIPSHSYGYTAGAKYREFLKENNFSTY